MPQEGRTEVQTWEFWPTELAHMFARAGMPKPEPPSFMPECESKDIVAGNPPRIVQPKDGLVYRLSLSNKSHESLAFIGQAEAGVKNLHWFVNGSYLGSRAPGEIILWKAVPGDAEVRVVDDAGRAAQKRVRVRAAQ